MQDYLMLMRSQGNPMENLSPEEMQQHLQQWGQWMGALAEQGKLTHGNPLEGHAACVRKDLVTDGPYAEAKDVVGGYLLITCESFEEAKAIAAGCPMIALGGLVEVRQMAPNVMS